MDRLDGSSLYNLLGQLKHPTHFSPRRINLKDNGSHLRIVEVFNSLSAPLPLGCHSSIHRRLVVQRRPAFTGRIAFHCLDDTLAVAVAVEDVFHAAPPFALAMTASIASSKASLQPWRSGAGPSITIDQRPPQCSEVVLACVVSHRYRSASFMAASRSALSAATSGLPCCAGFANSSLDNTGSPMNVGLSRSWIAFIASLYAPSVLIAVSYHVPE